MDIQWPLPIGVYEKIQTSPRDVYWLGPLPFSSRAGILVPDYAYGPRPFRDSATIHPGFFTVPLAPSRYLRNTAFNTSLSHRIIPNPVKFVEQQPLSASTDHVFPSEALRSLYRLAERVYSNPLDKNARPANSLQDSPSRPQPAVSPTRHGSGRVPPPLTIYDQRSLNVSSSLHTPSIADSTASLYTMNASTLAGDENGSVYWHQAEDIKATIRDFAASVQAWGKPLKDSSSGLEGVHFNPIKVNKDDEPWKHELLRVLNAYRDAVENNTALHSEASRLRDELEKSRSQASGLRKELKNATAGADAQASELTQTFEYERRCRVQAETDVASLQEEVAHLKAQLKATTKKLEEEHVREQKIQARFETLSASYEDLKVQLHEPQWVAKLKAELRDDLTGFGTGLRTAIAESQSCTVSSTEQVMASLKTLSNHSHSSFSHVSQELRHQREEMAHLRERNSQLVVSNEDLVKNASSMKEQLAAAINLGQETRSTVVSVSSAVEEKLPRLESTLHQTGDSIKVAVADVEAKLDSHISQSREHSANVTNVLHKRSEHSTKNHAHVSTSIAENKILLQNISDKLQEYASSTAQTYAALPTRSTANGDEAGPATMAIEALRAQFTTSLTAIREALDQTRVEVHKLVAQTTSQAERHDLFVKTADTTNTRLEQLDASIRQKGSAEDAGHSQTRALLVNIETSLATITAETWLQQAFSNSKVLTQEDLSQVHTTLQTVLAQLEILKTRKDEGLSQSIEDVASQVSEVNLKLSEMESMLQAAATTSDVVEEVSAVKAAHSNEHQASTAAVERVQSAVVSLEEYTKSAIDQINAALDEQQSRLVTIQTHTKHHSEDSKALTSYITESNGALKELETRIQSTESTSSTSTQSIITALEEIKASLTRFETSRVNDAEVLRDASASASSEALVNLQLTLKEQGEVLRSLPQVIHNQSSDKHDTLSSRTVEIVAMLTGLAASTEYTSKEIGELKDAISKLDSEVAAGHTRATEGLNTSGTSVASLSQSIEALSKEITEMRDQLLTSMSSRDTSAHIDERLDALLVELKSKTDIMNASVVEVKESLTRGITQIRQQSESDSQSFFAALEKVSAKSESTSTADFAALHALVEKQITDISTMESHLSKAQSAGVFDIKNQIEDLRGVILDTTLAEVLDSLRQLGVSVTDLRGLFTEENKTLSSSATALSSLELTLHGQADQFAQILKAHETHDKQYESTVEILDRNHTKLIEIQSGMEGHLAAAKDLTSSNHAAVISILEQSKTDSTARRALYEEKTSELLRALSSTQLALEQKGDSQATEFKAHITEISQAMIKLQASIKSYSLSSTSLQQDVKVLSETHNNLNIAIDKHFSETTVTLTNGFDSLRQEMVKNPDQFNALLVAIQAHITELKSTLEQSFKGSLEIIHRDIELQSVTVANLQTQPQIRLVGDGKDAVDSHVLEEQLTRMEQLRQSIEGLMIHHHHCNGCNCRGFDSNPSSPAKNRRALSQIGSDATGLSPNPYQQSFDIPSPKDTKKEIRSGEPARPYSIDSDGDHGISAGQTETVDLGDKSEIDRIHFPRPNSPPGSNKSQRRVSSGLLPSSSSTSGGDGHHHDHEISNPFELFSKRSRKSSHKPSEGSDESQDAGKRVKKSSTIGSGKGQRSSLLASALMSTVSDSAVPQTSRHRTTSGGLHRLSSIFGKHHHHHDDNHGSNKSTEEAPKIKGSTHDLTESKKEPEQKDGTA